jgi:MscS family membrane protein
MEMDLHVPLASRQHSMRKPLACSVHLSFSLLAVLAWAAMLASAVAAPPAAPPAKKPATPAAPRPKAKEVPLADRIRSPVDDSRAMTDKLRSPRETVKTFYFAILLYDLFPQMIDDAVACLDTDSLQPRHSPEDAARLALDLEDVLQSLALPLGTVPDQEDGDVGKKVVLYEGDGLSIALERCMDGGWRFDAATLARVPAMVRAVHKSRPQPRAADLAGLREEYRDPRATLRQFISDTARGDFYAAARALDLGALSTEERRQKGPALAQQLAFVIQHRGFMFRQEVPERNEGPPYTWHADKSGRVALSRVHQADGKDAWLFTRNTVRNIPRMYAAVQGKPADVRYVRLNMVIPPLKAGGAAAAQKRPDDVPAHLGSPRALLQGFFRTMDGADTNDAKLAEALEYLDLDNIPVADRTALGGKLAIKLDAVLRKLAIDLRTVPDDWNAPPQALGEAQGVRVEIVRQYDGTWSFSEATVAHVAEMFDKLASKAHSEQPRGWALDSARATMVAFQLAVRRRDYAQAARCLNLSDIPVGAQDELGTVLAFKLQYVLDRIGGIYVQEIPDNPEGPHYVLYRGELGRIVLDRKPDDPDKGHWLFTPESVGNIESMFLSLRGQPLEGQDDAAEALAAPRFWDTPGVWLRLRLPAWSQTKVGPLDLYQWLGLLLAMAASWAGARVTMTCVTHLTAWLLRRFGSTLSGGFVASTLRPLTVLTAVWTLFLLLQGLDLHVAVASPVFAVEKFFLAGLLGWLGLRLIDLSMGIYTNAELLRPHRSLGDMIVPVSMRLSKAAVVLIVATYMIYEIGELDLLGRFLTGLGVAGLAASLAAQDAMKSYFGTLLLIGERAFKIGDRISVGGKEGIVEQVGFRSTRLRNADNALITIPNAVVAAAAIDNMGPRSRHAFSTSIVLHPETPLTRLVDFRDRLRGWLVEQQLVAGDKVEVHIHQATVSGVELSVGLFLGSDAPADEAAFREALRCQALALAEALELKPVASPGTLIETLAPAPGQEESTPASQAA